MSKTSQDLMATSSQRRVAGAEIGSHHHRLHQIVYPSRGAVAVTTAMGTWISAANRAIWIPAGATHQHRFHGDTQFHCVAFDPGKYATVSHVPVVLLVDALARELIVACSQAEDIGDAANARRLDVLYDQLCMSAPQPLWIPSPKDHRLRQACRITAENLATPLALNHIGRMIGVSPRTLSRLFAADVAMSYRQWRTQLRVHHALRLLAEQHTVTEIAHACGWATPSAFIETFRRTLGYTPGQHQNADSLSEQRGNSRQARGLR